MNVKKNGFVPAGLWLRDWTVIKWITGLNYIVDIVVI